MSEAMNDPEAVAVGLLEFLRVWPDIHLQDVLPGLPGVIQEAVDLLRIMDRKPTTNAEYVAKALQEGAILKIQSPKFAELPQEVTHVTFVGGTEKPQVILRTKECHCQCHWSNTIIMHNQACCEPFGKP